MTRPTLTVVGKGDVPDAMEEARERAEEACRLIRETVEAGGQFFAVLDGDDPTACYWGNSLEIAALAEEVAGMCKRMALGLE